MVLFSSSSWAVDNKFCGELLIVAKNMWICVIVHWSVLCQTRKVKQLEQKCCRNAFSIMLQIVVIFPSSKSCPKFISNPLALIKGKVIFFHKSCEV